MPDITEFGLQGYFTLITFEFSSVTQPGLVKVSTVHELKVSDWTLLLCRVIGFTELLMVLTELTFRTVTVVLLLGKGGVTGPHVVVLLGSKVVLLMEIVSSLKEKMEELIASFESNSSSVPIFQDSVLHGVLIMLRVLTSKVELTLDSNADVEYVLLASELCVIELFSEAVKESSVEVFLVFGYSIIVASQRGFNCHGS